jgi:hypothetical protein
MSLATKDPLLERFCDQYAALKIADPQLRLYALVDFATMPENWQRQLAEIIEPMPRFALYGGTGLDDLSRFGPFLIVCPEPDGAEPLSVYQALLTLTKRDHRFVSWLWATHEVGPLVDHLQTLLHARLAPDDEDAWFFFHQPAYLPVLHRALPNETRQYMFGPCLGWWCLDPKGELVELPGDNLALPVAWESLPISEEVMSALHRAGAPVQVRAWLQRTRPDVLDNEGHANEQLQQLAPIVERAFEHGMTSKSDQGVYVAFALLYGPTYEDHPALQAVLSQFRAGKTALIDAYAALDDGVWKEVAGTTEQRAAQAATLAYQAKVKKRGYASLRVRLINASGYQKTNVEIVLPDEAHSSNESLGDIGAMGAKDIAMARVPVPGTTITLRWIGTDGFHRRDQALVTGDLPRVEGEGLAIVKFDRDHGDYRLYVSMHADEPKAVGQLWP